MEPGSTGLGGFAALKIALAFGMPAAMAALIGMLLMPPRSSREFVARTACTVVSSFLFGPLLAIGMIAWMPDIVSSAYWLAQRTGLGEDGLLAMFYVLGPCMLLAGLPAWWVLGAYLRLTAKLQNQDLVDWAVEIRRKALGLGQVRRKEEIMTLEQVMRDAVRPALALLPAAMNTPQARCMLLAIGLQESRFVHRRQIGGPARGFWQFERGTRTSRGGVWGCTCTTRQRPPGGAVRGP